jgi:signal transduction histidine kinase/DNA-binding response OmpR family regulator/ligand-binding sensor domain-containing protein
MSKFQSLYFLLFLMISAFGSPALAQTGLGYETISTAQGLSQGLINDMLQDKEGFIWIATKSGLNRYDGYTFKIFTTDPQDINSISSNTLSNLLEDRMGRLWIGTYDKGINVYDKKTGRMVRISHNPADSSGLSGNRIASAMLELPDGRVLVCPQNASLNIVSLSGKPGSKPSFAHLKVPGNREIVGIGKDDKDFIWVGCTDGSIFIFIPSSETFEMLTDGRTFTALIEKTGTHLSAKSSQLFFLKPSVQQSFRFQDTNGQIRSGVISNGTNGDVLLNNRYPIKKGLSGSLFYDLSSLKVGSGVDEVKSIYLQSFDNEHTIKCMLLDRSGVLWVGMLGQGLYKYRIGSQAFKPILPNLSVQQIRLLNKKIVYVQGWRSIKTVTPEGLECDNPLKPVIGVSLGSNVLQARNGEFWIYDRDQKKLTRYTADLKPLRTYDQPISPKPSDHLQPLIEDSRNRIWICGNDGTLARIDPANGKLTSFSIAVDPGNGKSDQVQTKVFYEDSSGVFWLGTEYGFARVTFKNDEIDEVKWFKNIPGNSNSLNYNYVSWFMDDPAHPGYLWISTQGGGLNLLHKSTGNFVNYTVKQGLPNDVVYGTLTDAGNNIWGSTNRGLFCILSETGRGSEKPVIRTFATGDGLQTDEFNTNAFCKLLNGDLVFGGVNGINIFNPKKVLAASFMPRVFITSIQIGNKILSPGDNFGVLTEAIEQTRTITLSYLQDVVTLEFSSLDFTAPHQNKYRYQLAGIDEEWVESSSRRTATYLHLPAGNYVFKVQGSNSQGIWSSHIAELSIRVLPPWWLSWWAYVSYVLIVALSIRWYLKFNVNKAKLRSQLNYEQLEAKRMKEMDVIKTQLYTNITHEFRTPLTVILGMAAQVIEKPGELFESRMEMIVRNGRSLLNLVNQMLDLSKLESGKMHLQLSKGNVIQFLRYVVESFLSLAGSEQKQLHFLTNVNVLYMEYDQEKLRQIVSNLLSNAIKFTLEKGNIYISVQESLPVNDTENSILIIKVKDTGTGISEDHIAFIFDRFYQSDDSHTRNTEGTGVGLALTKELVKLMKGEITVESPPVGAFTGSEFTVSLPLKKVAPFMETGINDLKRQPVSAKNILPYFNTFRTQDEGNGINVPLILLVEDNADVVAYTASCISNYRLVVGTDGREGFDIATDLIPDLIITDVMMPLVDGFEMTAKLRQNENTSHIPIIMLTAKADISSKLEGLEYGADVYLEKPFNKQELLVRIKKLLEMRRNLQEYYLKKAGIHNDAMLEHEVMPEKMNTQVREDSFVKRVREAVEQNYTDVNFTVEKLTKLVFMSHSQLHRKLEALTGYSPNKFIRMIRLKKAKELLQDPANSVASVAMECGYDDPAYFTRVFRQEFNDTPQKWRALNS